VLRARRLPGALGEEPTRPVKREKATQIWGGGGCGQRRRRLCWPAAA